MIALYCENDFFPVAGEDDDWNRQLNSARKWRDSPQRSGRTCRLSLGKRVDDPADMGHLSVFRRTV